MAIAVVGGLVLLANGGFAASSPALPTAIAAAYGYVWVGTNDGELAKIDPRTRRIVGTTRVGTFIWDLAPATGGIWAATDRGLVRIDPRSLRGTAAKAPIRLLATIVVTVGRQLWLTSSSGGRLVRFDPRRDAVTASVSLRGRALALAAGAGRLWVVLGPAKRLTGPKGPRTLHAVRLSTARPLAWRRDLGCDASTTTVGDELLIADACGNLTAFPLSGQTAPIQLSGLGAMHMVRAAFGFVWTAGERLTRIDLEHRDRVSVAEVAGVVDVTESPAGLWVVRYRKPQLLLVDGRSAKILARIGL